jgi:DNA end-binding protein Ku
MARAFWKGSISLGMVLIPVGLVVATRERPLNFNILHKKCLTRPRQVWWCEKDEEYFDNEDTVRGYEYAKGRYITLKEIDFERVPVTTKRLIEISSFADAEAIDPILYHRGYYVEPQQKGFKAYSLLKQVMQDSGKVAIAKITMQRRENLCMLIPVEGMIELYTLFYSDEVTPASELNIPRMELTEKEIDTANSLVKNMVRKFDLEEYHDEYHAALIKVIKAKLKGVEIPEVKKPRTQPEENLLEALESSLPAAKKKEKATAGK